MSLLGFLEYKNNVLYIFISPANTVHVVGLISEAELLWTIVLTIETPCKMSLLQQCVALELSLEKAH